MTLRNKWQLGTLVTACLIVAIDCPRAEAGTELTTVMSGNAATQVIAPKGWVAKVGLSSSAYQSLFDDLTKKGFRVTSISGYMNGNEVEYAAVFKMAPYVRQYARHGLSPSEYQKEFTDRGKEGFRLTYVSGYEVGGEARYAAIWERNFNPPPSALHGYTLADYEKAIALNRRRGYVPSHVSAYTVQGTPLFAAIFQRDGSDRIERHDLSSSAYSNFYDQVAKQGYRIRTSTGYRVGSEDRFAAIWERTPLPRGTMPSQAPVAIRHAIPGRFAQNVSDNYANQGYEPLFLTAYVSVDGPKVDGSWRNDTFTNADLGLIAGKAYNYLATTGYPGLSIALAKDGKLVFAAGFGKADKSTGEEVGPNSRFRIASVSKPITAIAVMRLAESVPGLLDKIVFGKTGILGPKYDHPKAPNLNKITVRQLLQHVAGFSPIPSKDGPIDPMFAYLDYSHEKLIAWAISMGIQARAPGMRYDYSNFGYCILGRVIEQLTGKSYDAYVKEAVLKPSFAFGMELAANTEKERKANEVLYYGDWAYNLNVTRFDAHGGWIATASDLLRVMVRADNLPTKPDMINAASYATMTKPAGIVGLDGKDPSYALGWGVMGETITHNGSMAGTTAVLVRAPGGWTYAGIANMQIKEKDQWAGVMRQMLADIVSGVSKWPTYDLF